jgi:outer membrane protein TolC
MTKTAFCCSLLLVCATRLLGQDAPQQSLKLTTAVELAQTNYPAIRAAMASATAAKAGEDLARTAYLPHVDLLWQENRATRNNVFGLLLPQSVIPAISGPQLTTKTYQSAWGSAGGVLASWEPVDFGLRRANVELARAQNAQAEATVALTVLDVSATAADLFLIALAAEQSTRAAQAAVDRMQVFLGSVRVLVEQQLRPGVDVSRAEAEIAALRNQLIQSQQNLSIARINLSEAIGQAGAAATLDSTPFLDLPPVTPPLPGEQTLPRPPDFGLHPMLRVQAAAIETVRAREHALDRAYVPRFNLQTAFFGRGTGARLDGTFDNSRGWYPNSGNWAVGITITFPAFDFFGLRARRRIEENNERAERARYDQTLQTLTAQDARARAIIEGARRIAENTPLQVKAARETLERVRVRYEYGLTTVVEVADAQRLMAQAEADDAIARLGVWRALLAAARLQGSLQPFIERVDRMEKKN